MGREPENIGLPTTRISHNGMSVGPMWPIASSNVSPIQRVTTAGSNLLMQRETAAAVDRGVPYLPLNEYLPGSCLYAPTPGVWIFLEGSPTEFEHSEIIEASPPSIVVCRHGCEALKSRRLRTILEALADQVSTCFGTEHRCIDLQVVDARLVDSLLPQLHRLWHRAVIGNLPAGSTSAFHDN